MYFWHMKTEIFELDNGIKCVLQRINSPVAHIGLTINAGTRDENDNEHGVAHLIEHLLFKGTIKRKPFHINSLLDNVGGELNAYTSKEETVVHATMLKGDFSRGVDLVSDVVFNSQFPECEIEKERNVIIDEINSYKDSPSELIYDDFEDMVFRGCSLGRNILGSRRSLKKISRNNLLSFTERCYNTDGMVFSAIANISQNRFRAVCDTYLGAIPSKKSNMSRSVIPEYVKEHRSVNKGTYQTHCVLGARSYDSQDKRRVALALLTNILGGPSPVSRLNNVLREKHGLSYTVETGLTSYSDTGISSIYFSAEKDNIDKCLTLVFGELKKLRDASLSSTQLSRAKKQFGSQLVISSESAESMMLSAGKSLMIYNKVDPIEALRAKVDAVSASEIIEAANEIFCEDNMSMLIYK